MEATIHRTLIARLIVISASASALSGCLMFQTDTVYLERAAKSCQPGKDCAERVQCGPYARVGGVGGGASAEDEALRHCVADFQSAGYQRVPGPKN
jgi:hypothetical protein